ncbi:molybdate ABC transporter substrate-binding protein [Alloyangia pacifica]|uniref:molybdate ABC transporter substrate-binding protein n=1 Tax=Alloyangia pacifica TaxID=311180 RepID=UPI0031DD3FC6
MPKHILPAIAVLGLVMTGPATAKEPISLVAAGSLKAALGQVAHAFQNDTGIAVETTFGPSGLMRQSIEDGAPAHVFASANMAHPQALAEAGKGGPVVLFARNRLCGLAQPGLEVSGDTLLDVMLAQTTRLGTSTPGADPSGDYAWQLFDKADELRLGARAELESKALQLTGGPESEAAPAGRNPYAWVMENNRADLFLTYCTNAVLAQRELPELQIVTVPQALSVGADYGLIVLEDAPPSAWDLAFHILSPDGQRVLASYGFDAPGRVGE